MTRRRVAPPCPVCLHHHHASDVPAEGRFRADGPLGYRPRYPGAPLHPTREAALADLCDWRARQMQPALIGEP